MESGMQKMESGMQKKAGTECKHVGNVSMNGCLISWVFPPHLHSSLLTILLTRLRMLLLVCLCTTTCVQSRLTSVGDGEKVPGRNTSSLDYSYSSGHGCAGMPEDVSSKFCISGAGSG